MWKNDLWSAGELGYDVQWQVLNSKNFGIPQNRERVFIIGHFRENPRPQVFPIRDGEQVHIQPNAGELEGREELQPTVVNTITSNYWKGVGGNRPFIVEPPHKHGEIRIYHDIMPTIQARYGTGGNNVPYVNGIRKLTPVEYERLMGFPDNWTEGISDTQRYKCLGNAVVVNVIEYVSSKLLTK